MLKTFAFLAMLTLAGAGLARAEENTLTPDNTVSADAGPGASLPEPPRPGHGPGHGGPGHGPGWGGPGHGPGWGGPGWGHGPRGFTCFARNWRGQTFSAFGWNPQQTQWEAMRQCQYRSFNPRSCRALGCR